MLRNMNLPNLLSLFRIATIPLLVFVYYLPFNWSKVLASALFTLAAITDLLDGFLARVLKQTTPLGAFLDPVADKLIVVTVIVLLLGRSDLHHLTVASIVIIGREVAVSALREWMAELGKRTSVAVSFLGKIKTTLQMVSLIILLYCHVGVAVWLVWLGQILYHLAAILTLWSMLIYFKAAWPQLVSQSSKKNQ